MLSIDEFPKNYIEVKVYDCGCKIGRSLIAPLLKIFLCPTHKAAPALLAALEAVEWISNHVGDKVCPSCKGIRRLTGHWNECQLDAALKQARPHEVRT